MQFTVATSEPHSQVKMSGDRLDLVTAATGARRGTAAVRSKAGLTERVRWAFLGDAARMGSDGGGAVKAAPALVPGALARGDSAGPADATRADRGVSCTPPMALVAHLVSACPVTEGRARWVWGQSGGWTGREVGADAVRDVAVTPTMLRDHSIAVYAAVSLPPPLPPA